MNYGGIASGVGGMLGGLITGSMLGSAANKASGQINKGTGYLQGLNEQQRSDYSPYMQAGQAGTGQYQNLLAQGNTAAQPTQSAAFSYDANTDPSTQYRIDQANKAIEASGVAGGRVGGGLSKALAANSQNMASQEYQNAYNRYLAQNQQDFGQQQQIYNNQTQNYQNLLAGYGNLMNTGLQATQGTTSAAGGYGSAVNQNYNNLANMAYGSGADRASAVGGGMKSLFSGISSLF